MLCSLKIAKKHMYVYCFHGKHFKCWELRGMPETDNFAQKDSKLIIPVGLKVSQFDVMNDKING